MKIITLVENTACGQNMHPEHGLSLYIETKDHKILFDMGQTDAFARNAEALGIDLSGVDFAVLSHGHYDHGGGLSAFLQINQKAPVYIHEKAFGQYYNGTEKYIGLDASLRKHPRIVFTKESLHVFPGILLTDCSDQNWRNDSFGLNRREGDFFAPDDFCHEQYLQITEGEKHILISGCSHRGILNIAEHFRADVLVGGFHLNKQQDPVVLRSIATKLHSYGTIYYTGHCTGASQFTVMKQNMGNSLQSISTGVVITI